MNPPGPFPFCFFGRFTSILNSTILNSVPGENNQVVAGAIGATATLTTVATYYALRPRDDERDFAGRPTFKSGTLSQIGWCGCIQSRCFDETMAHSKCFRVSDFPFLNFLNLEYSDWKWNCQDPDCCCLLPETMQFAVTGTRYEPVNRSNRATESHSVIRCGYMCFR